MDNKKYAAALLEGGSFSEKERMKSAIDIVREMLNEATCSFLKDRALVESSELGNTFETMAQDKLKKIAPELAEKYEVKIGCFWDDVFMKGNLYVGYREKLEPEEAFNRMTMGHRHGGTVIGDGRVTTATIQPLDASRITAGTITAAAIRADQFRPEALARAGIHSIPWEDIRDVGFDNRSLTEEMRESNLRRVVSGIRDELRYRLIRYSQREWRSILHIHDIVDEVLQTHRRSGSIRDFEINSMNERYTSHYGVEVDITIRTALSEEETHINITI